MMVSKFCTSILISNFFEATRANADMSTRLEQLRAVFVPFIVNNWKAISAASATAAFLITTLLMWHSFRETLTVTKHIHETNLARDLFKSFREDQTFKNIQKAISQCETLYDKDGGAFAYTDINSYLAALDEVAFYYNAGVLNLELIDHFFGGAMIEAHSYEELKGYIAKIRKNSAEPDALVDFEAVAAKLADLPKRRSQARLWTRDCRKAT